MELKILPVGLVFFLVCIPAQAMRCGKHIIDSGSHAIEVRRKCGDPTYIHTETIYRTGIPRQYPYNKGRYYRGDSNANDELLIHERSIVEVQVQEWVYNLGSNRLIRTVRFENGRVTDILTDQGYGFH